MIEDEELREIFKVDSEEHLQNLEQGLLQLENDLDNKSLIEEMFREAHTLKGSSRMIGVENVGIIAHRFEDILGGAHRGEYSLSPEIINGLYKQIDALRALVKEAVTGEPAEIELSSVLNMLDTLKVSEDASDKIDHKPRPMKQAKKRVDVSGKQDNEVETLKAEEGIAESGREVKKDTTVKDKAAPPPDRKKYTIDTVRVSTSRLDDLMRSSGELKVARLRILEELPRIDEIIALWESANRDFKSFLQRSIIDKSFSARDGKTDEIINLHLKRIEELGEELIKFRETIYTNSRNLDIISSRLEGDVQEIRLLPFSIISGLFPRMVRDLARERGKKIRFSIYGEDTRADKHIIEEVKDPLMHILRNAVDHGIETPEERLAAGKDEVAELSLRFSQTPISVVIEVSDDGKGLDLDSIKNTALKRGLVTPDELEKISEEQIKDFIFQSGFSTSALITDISGRGVGLDVVRENVERLKGRVEAISEPGKGTIFRLTLPITLATLRAIILKLGQRLYALPAENVEMTRLISRNDLFILKGQNAITVDGEVVYLTQLRQILELAEEEMDENPEDDTISCVVIRYGDAKLGLIVDKLLDEQEIVLKQFGKIMERVRNVSGVTILGTGEMCLLLNSHDLIKSAFRSGITPVVKKKVEEGRKKVVLLVEDSLTTRTQEKRILEAAGYEVVIAVDGLDALEKLSMRNVDAVVSDIQMPRMDGFALLEKLRKMKRYRDIPVVLVTSLTSDDDKRRGLELGADAYITKPAFNQEMLTTTLKRLI